MAARGESRPVRTPVKAVRSHPGTNRACAHLYLAAASSARALKDPEVRDVPSARSPNWQKQEVTVWALVLVLGLAILTAGYILLEKTCGSFY